MMEKPFNITQIIEQRRLGLKVPKQVDIAYSKLKCTADDLKYFENPLGEEYHCPVFVSKFCHINNFEHVLAAANEDGKIALLDTKLFKKDKVLTSFQAHDNAIFDVAWTNFDLKLLSASGDHSSTLWQVSEANVQSLLQFHGHQHSVKVVTCRPDDQYTFATGARDGALLVWDIRVPDLVTEVKPDVSINFAHEAPGFLDRKAVKQTNSITGLVYQDNYNLISCSAGNGLIKVWDMRKTYTVCKRLPLAKYVLPYCGSSGRNGFSSLAISPCRLRLYANCIDNKLYCYNIGTFSEKPIAIYSGHHVTSFYIKTSVSPDGQYVASGSNDGKAYIWSVSDPSVPLVSLNGHNAEVMGVDWCKAGEPKIVSCSDDATYRVWRVNPQEFDCHDPTLRGWAERYRLKEICPKQSSLKRKFYLCRHMDLIPRFDTKDQNSVNIEEMQIEKRPCLNKSLDLSSLTANLPNYVLDGVSPHLHRCSSSPRIRDANWLEKLRKNTLHIDKKPQLSPSRRKSSLKRTAKQSILRFFKVSSRQAACEQSSSSPSDSKNIQKPVNLS